MEEAQVASDVVETTVEATKPALTKGQKAGIVAGALTVVGLCTFGIVKLVKHFKSKKQPTVVNK